MPRESIILVVAFAEAVGLLWTLFATLEVFNDPFPGIVGFLLLWPAYLVLWASFLFSQIGGWTIHPYVLIGLIGLMLGTAGGLAGLYWLRKQ